MRRSAAIVSIVLLLISSVAHAADSWHTSTLKFVYPLGDGSFVVGFTQNSVYCTNPNNPQYFYVVAGQYGVTADGVKAMLATALVAYTQGSTLSIAFDGTSSACYINRFSITQP